MSGLEKRVDENEINVKDLEQHDEMRSKYDKIKEIEKYVQTSKDENADPKRALKEMKTVNNKLKEDLLDLKSRNMRDNLIFTNNQE